MANDPLELLAVSGPANEQKGDADAASWLPPNKAFRCSYVAIQVAVKMRYHLWVTPAEHAAIARVLSTCPTQPLPTGGPPPPPALPRSRRPLAPCQPLRRATTPVPVPHAQPPQVLPIVHPGAFCSPPGARGVTSAGTPHDVQARQHRTALPLEQGINLALGGFGAIRTGSLTPGNSVRGPPMRSATVRYAPHASGPVGTLDLDGGCGVGLTVETATRTLGADGPLAIALRAARQGDLGHPGGRQRPLGRRSRFQGREKRCG